MHTPIAVLGAGSIGCYVGGVLVNGGSDIRFIGRRNTADRIKQVGLTLSAIDSDPVFIEGSQINWSTDPAVMAGCETVLLCTKSADTPASAKLIKTYCDKNTVVISLQNGVGNVKLLRDTLGDMTILSAMVSFNVARIGDKPLRFHRGTDGEIIFQQHEITDRLSKLLNNNGVNAWCVEDMEPIAWGKLLMNLNNAVNVISGLPLKQQLQTRSYRRILAACVREALVVVRAAGIKPAKVGKVPPRLMPFILQLPDAIFNIVARGMLNIDDNARSSMWEDLQAGRKPEIDFLNGAICELGARTQIPTPVNDLMVRLVKELFSGGSTHCLDANDILDGIKAAGALRASKN